MRFNSVFKGLILTSPSFSRCVALLVPACMRSKCVLQRRFSKISVGLDLVRKSVCRCWECRVGRGSTHKEQTWDL